MRRGSHMTDEQRAVNSASHLGQIARNKGIPMTDEQRAKCSAAHIGLCRSLESRAKQSATMIGHAVSLEARAKLSIAHTGLKASPETRAKQSAAHMGKPIAKEILAKRSASQWKGGRIVTGRKSRSKRRGLGFVYLNQPFLGCAGHHVDNEQVINMPAKLHQSISHNQHTGRGMAQINAVAYNYLFKQEVEAAMKERAEKEVLQ